MNSTKLVESFVILNSTPKIQMEAFARNVNNQEKFITDLSVKVFDLPKRDRTVKQLENELTAIFIKRIGVPGLVSSFFSGLVDKSGPIEGIKKNVIQKACVKMGFKHPDSVTSNH